MKPSSRIAKLVSIVSSLALAFMLVPAVGLPASRGASNTAVDMALAASRAASTGARYNAGYNNAKAKYPQWARALDSKEFVAYVPGLASVNFDGNVCADMVPQGISTFGNYYLITAYCSKKQHNSVVYVLNKHDGSYVRTIEFYEKAHFGAVTTDMHGYSTNNFAPDKEQALVPVSNRVPHQRIIEIQQNELLETMAYSSDPITVSHSWNSTPHGTFYTSGEAGMSCLATYGNYQYPARFDQSDAKLNYMHATWWGNGAPESGRIQLPLRVQGIDFWKTGGQIYLLCMTSHGRKNASTLYVYKVNSTGGANTVRYPVGKPVATVTFPNMGEDICVDNGHLLTCYESAAHVYQNGDGKGYSPYPIDRITSHYLKSFLPAGGFRSAAGKQSANKSASLKGDNADMVTELASGTCGDNLTWTLSSDGVLDIHGTGEMMNYATSGDAPWSNYADQIKCVSVDSGATSLGANSFGGCENVKSVYLPEVVNDDGEQSFEVGAKALADCNSLERLVLEGVSSFADDALDGVSGVQVQADYQVEGLSDVSGVTVHEHEYEYVETVDANCGSVGYDLYRCSCGEEQIENTVAATGEHDYQLTETQASTCKEAGHETHTCAVCGDSYEVALPLAEHSWQLGTEADATGMTTDTCSVCGGQRERSLLVESVAYSRAEANNLNEAIDCKVVEEDGQEQLWYDARCGVGDEIVIEGDPSVAGTYSCTASPRGDGNATEATDPSQYTFRTDDGKVLDSAYLAIEDDQSSDNLWGPENPGHITVAYKGVSTTTQVAVKPNGICDLSYVPGPDHRFIEGKSGSFVRDGDNVYFRYDLQFEPGDVVNLNMKDGTVQSYTYNGEAFVGENGNALQGAVDLSSEQEFEHWSVESGGEVALRYLNRSGTSFVNVESDSEHDSDCRILFAGNDAAVTVAYVARGEKLDAAKIPVTPNPRYDGSDSLFVYAWVGHDEEWNDCTLADLSKAIDKNMTFVLESEYESCVYVERVNSAGKKVRVCRVCGHTLNAAQKEAGLAVGKKAVAGGLTYKATSKSAVALAKGAAKANVTVPATVRLAGKTYAVTAIGAKAFAGNKKLKKVVVGKNVASIGKQAFFKCTKLKTIILKTTKLKAGKVGAKAFAKIAKKAQVKCGKKAKAYKKWLYKKGLPKKAKVKK